MSLKCGLNDALARALYGRNAQWNITSLFYFIVIEVYLRDQNIYIEKRYSHDDCKEWSVEDIVNDVMQEVESKVHNGS